MIGKTISHYKILEKLGEGGMGVVYKVEDTKLRRTVGLKLLSAAALEDEDNKSRFLREARAAGALNHPSICTIHEIDEHESAPFIVMEYVEGESLDEKIQSGPLELKQAVDIAAQVAEGLGLAHAAGVVHRDIKPGNVMVTESGQVKIMDFGLAKSVAGTRVTKTGTTLGTLAYMSPEQIQGAVVDHRTDIWSLGAVIYEMVAGRAPFKSDYDMALAYSIINLDHQPLSGLRGQAPAELCRVVDRCLEKDAEDRYGDVSGLTADLKSVAEILEASSATGGPGMERAGGDRSGVCGAAPGLDGAVGAEPPEAMPQKIGGYTLKQMIGSGGMGTVYLAMQERPRRTVALKLMRAGIASRSAMRRFEYEAQILARLRHPNIAQVYDAGTHEEEGRRTPFFVMEYIPGAKPLIDYAKGRNLSTRQRLELFTKVCDAVHHGHQKGIIHRDLKPANILVDSSGEPKIIDFGVARATDSDLAVTTLQTDIGQLVGTLQYMSPEQCEADPHDLDTRSDVYSLGVVLYELLCEKVPYDVKAAGIYKAAQVIREEEPRRPSTLNRTLRGDVETIALKALEKERERRYQSADELRRDVVRYLNGEPIAARPPSVMYQMSVFARRNRVLVGSILGIVAISVAAAIVSTTMYLKSESARRQAERRFAIAREGADLLLTGLSDELPDIVGTGRLQRDLLEKAQKHYEKLVEERPDDLEEHRRIWLGLAQLGKAYTRLGEMKRARSALTQYNELAARAVDRFPEDARYLRDLCESHLLLGHIDLQEDNLAGGETHSQSALRLAERLIEVDGDSPDNLYHLSKACESAGRIAHRKGQLDEAKSYFDRAFAISKRLVDDHPGELRYHQLLSLDYNDQARMAWTSGEHGEAREIFLSMRDFDRSAAEREPASPVFQHFLAQDERLLGDLAADMEDWETAREHYMNGVSMAEKLVAAEPTHPRFKSTLAELRNMLGDLALRQDDLQGALREFSEATATMERLVDLEPTMWQYESCLGGLYRRLSIIAWQLGDTEAAYSYREKTLRSVERLIAISPDNVDSWGWMGEDARVLADMASQREKRDDVRRWESRRLEALKSIAERSDATARNLNDYAWFLLTCHTEEMRDPSTALTFAQRASRLQDDKDANTMDTLALAYHLTGDHEGAVEAQRKAIALIEAGGNEAPERFRARLNQYMEALNQGAR